MNSVSKTELGDHVADVGLDRGAADEESTCYLGVRQTPGDELQHLYFSSGQLRNIEGSAADQLLVVAIVVARVNQWTGRARWAPLIAKVYVAVALAALAILPETPALVVQSVAVAALYGWLGWVIRTDVASGRGVRDERVTQISGLSAESAGARP